MTLVSDLIRPKEEAMIFDSLVNSEGKKNVRRGFFRPNYFAISGNNCIKEIDFGGTSIEMYFVVPFK